MAIMAEGGMDDFYRAQQLCIQKAMQKNFIKVLFENSDADISDILMNVESAFDAEIEYLAGKVN